MSSLLKNEQKKEAKLIGVSYVIKIYVLFLKNKIWTSFIW